MTTKKPDLMNGIATDIGTAFVRGIKAAVDQSLDEKLDAALDAKFKEQEKLIVSNYDEFEKKMDTRNKELQNTINQNTQAQIHQAILDLQKSKDHS